MTQRRELDPHLLPRDKAFLVARGVPVSVTFENGVRTEWYAPGCLPEGED